MNPDSDSIDPRRDAHAVVLAELFDDAYKASPLEFIFTLLRVGGYQMENWDPFEESQDALEDYNDLLAHSRARSALAVRRVGLLMYCHLVEMSAIHELLANLLRCKSGQRYRYAPLDFLGRRKKRPRGVEVFLNYVPPGVPRVYWTPWRRVLWAASNCSGLTPPRWPRRRERL
jgi:hypothetical protein